MLKEPAAAASFALSWQQRRLWTSPASAGGSRPVRLTALLAGPLRRERLRQAVEQVVERYEILRTTFRSLPGMKLPVQAVDGGGAVVLHEHDLTGRGQAAQELAATVGGEAAFDLEAGPPLRVDLVALASARYLLVLRLPVLCADEPTLLLLLGEIAAAYAGDGPGAEPPLQYVDLAQWHEDLLAAESAGAGRAYWRKQDLPPAWDLPAVLGGGQPPASAGPAPGEAGEAAPRSCRATLPAEVVARAGAVARDCGVPLSTALLACWQVLLWLLAGDASAPGCVGVGFDGRSFPGLERAVGPLARYLPVGCAPGAGERFGDLLARLEKLLRDHAEWQEYFWWDGGGQPPAGRPSAYPALFDYAAEMESYRAGDLVLSPLERDACAEPFCLRLRGVEQGGGLAVELSYDPRLIVRHAAERLLAQLTALLSGLTADLPVATAPILPAAERHRLLVEYNDTAAELAAPTCLHRPFEDQAARAPERWAVIAEGERLTYGELDRWAGRLAARLRSLGVGPGTRVGVCLEPCAGMVAGLLAVLKAGGCYVPLDPAQPAERLAWMIDDVAAPLLLRGDAGVEMPPGHRVRQLALGGPPAAEKAPPEVAPRQPAGDAPAAPAATPDDLAYVLYTSGSSGRPKGVMVAHRAICNRLLWMQSAFPLSAADRVLQRTPFSFDASIWEIFLPLWCGATVIVAAPGGHRDTAYLAQAAAEHEVTILQLVPSLLQVWIEEPAVERCRSLRRVFAGGETLARGSVERFFARHGAALHNLYGPTEAAIDTTCWTCRRDEGPGAVPIGRPIANARVYILSAAGQPVPAGVPGELHIAGRGLARGYLGRPDLTARSFVPDPFAGRPGERLYRSGDLARHRGDGTLEILGRIDEQVKVRGFRIELGEIEATLARHPGVQQAVVSVREDAPGDRRLVAYLVGRPLAVPEEAELRSFLEQRLPAYMIPAAWVSLDSLPRLPNGKISRAALPAPAARRPAAARPRVAPRTPAEERLAAIWAEVLGLDAVGVDDNFFALGGDSILCLQVVSRAGKAGIRFTSRQLFEHQTIAALMAAAATAEPSQAARRPSGGAVPLIPIQQLFFAHQPADPHHFNQAVLLTLLQPPAVAHRQALLEQVVANHDALRLRFVRTTPAPGAAAAAAAEPGWRQVLSPPEAVPGALASSLDLTALPRERQTECLAAAAARAHAGFDLERGPLLRAVFLTLGGGGCDRLLLVAHHLVVDGVSWRVLLEDLKTGCEQLQRGTAISLPAATTSFQEWAERTAEVARSGALAGELDDWLDPRRRLVTPLPVDDPPGRSANTVASAESFEVTLGEAETCDLLQQVPETYRIQAGELLVAALAQALVPLADRRVVLLDLEGHGREEALVPGVDLSRTVGWFTTVLPLLLDLRDVSGPRELLATVKQQLRALPHHGIGYGLLRFAGGDAAAAQALGALPQAEVSFNYLGRLDQVLAGPSPFAPAEESAGPAQSPRQARRHLLDVNAFVAAGRLTVSWGFSRNVHRRATVERLAESFAAALRRLIRYCLSAAEAGFTPVDFPLARLDQRALDRLAGGDRAVVDIYPLSPLQRGLLFHSQRHRGSGDYFQQVSCILAGKLDGASFLRAWQMVVARHPILRTAFVWEDLAEPLQVVREGIELPWEDGDWRELSPGEQEERLDRYLREDRRRGFEVAQAPLMRVALLRLAGDRHALVWSSHHLVLDGWSAPVLVREVVTLYHALAAGRDAVLPLPPPYRAYVEWLLRQDLGAAQSYWRRALAGFTRPTPLARRPAAAGAAGGRGELTFVIPAAETSRLQALAVRQRVTLHTLAQGAWALLLGHLSGRRDVLFGAVVAGRPETLAGSGGMVGAFINTLPVRVRIDEQSALVPWLEKLQAEQAEARQFEYSPLVEVQGWSEVPRGLPLFESTFSFNNFPVGEAFGGEGPGFAVAGVRWLEQTSYPLDLTIGVGAELAVRVMYSKERFTPAASASLARQFTALLATAAARPEVRIADLLSELASSEREEQSMPQKSPEKSSFSRFKSVQPQVMSVAERLVDRGPLRPGEALPLVVQPAADDLDVAEWSLGHRDDIAADLARHGAILFRGFQLGSAEAFERFARAVCGELFEDNGEHPRETVSGSVYTPVFYPPEQRLLWHNENSFDYRWPMKILFGCVRPADWGGETPIVDSRQVFARLAPAVRERFVERGVMYMRNYGGGPGLDWQTVFHTHERAQVEAFCRDNHMTCEWRDGDRLRTRAVRPAVVRHPGTGEMSWFNQAQHWHVSCLDAATRESMAAIFRPEDMPRGCCYGDGTPIADEEIAAILAVYAELEVSFAWRQGDVLLVDNVLAAHGRNPFGGERKLLVALGELTTFAAVA
ncbi:MAG TPA: amino acid adenylation domain-containing protein [Thermoanaerobaculia bacterium]|nr:amino acid adenylation domain-containing protein [Thermoanaerobaculia bacterium]